MSSPAVEKSAETFESLFASFQANYAKMGDAYKEMKVALKKLHQLHSAEVKTALKMKPVKKHKEPREKVPMPVPQVLAKHLGIQEKMLDRDALLGRVFDYLKANCAQEKVDKPSESGKKGSETCYVADKLCETVFDGVTAGDLIPVLLVTSKLKGACERDAAFAKYKQQLDDSKKKEKEAAAAAKKAEAAAKKAAKKAAKPAAKPAIEAAPAAAVVVAAGDADDFEDEEVAAPAPKKRVVRKK